MKLLEVVELTKNLSKLSLLEVGFRLRLRAQGETTRTDQKLVKTVTIGGWV